MGDWSALNTLGPVRVAAIYLRAGLRCTYCGGRTLLGKRQVDHVLPRAKPWCGPDTADNLVLRRARARAAYREREAGDFFDARAAA